MKQEDKRNHTLYVHYSNLDYYKLYKEEFENTVDIATYRAVIKQINSQIKDAIVDEVYDFKLPKRLGIIAIRKHKQKIKIVDGKKIGFNLPPDWIATKKLWEEDEEAKQNKILIRHENKHSGGYRYGIRYFKRTANFKNKTLYKFKPTRTVARQLASNIKNNNLDAFLYEK